MWYKYASAEKAFNKMADQLLETSIKKQYWLVHHVFPSVQELNLAKKRAMNFIKNNYGSLWDLRNENMDRKIQSIVDEVKITI